jgi:hemerythrin superfamily protein
MGTWLAASSDNPLREDVMVMRKKTTTQRGSAGARAKDAIALLRADHTEVSELFERFEKSRTSTQKRAVVAEICRALIVHAQIEQEIFYPEVQAALKDHKLIPEALVEHDSLKALMVQVQAVEPSGEMYDARVRVMSEYVKHHVKEEQNELFPKVRSSKKIDLADLGARLERRKQELLAARG